MAVISLDATFDRKLAKITLLILTKKITGTVEHSRAVGIDTF